MPMRCMIRDYCHFSIIGYFKYLENIFAIMSLVFIKSEKNKSMYNIVYSFLHTQEKMYNKKTYWKCSESKKLKSKGRVHIVNKIS